MGASYLLYLFLDQLTILIGLKVCEGEGEGGAGGGEADGENSGQKHFIHFFKNLKQEKLPSCLNIFPRVVLC